MKHSTVGEKRTLLAQTIHTVGSMAGNQILQIAAGIAISRVYGPAGKGVVTYAGIAILGVIAVADGLSSAIAREYGDDRSRGAAACGAAIRIILILSALLGIPLIVLGWFVPAQRALLYVGVSLPFALYFQTMSGFHLIALRVERTNVAALVINGGAALVMLIVTICMHPPIDVIMSIWSIGYVAGAAIIYGGLTRAPVHARELWASFGAQIRFAAKSSSASLLTFLAGRIDVFIVAGILSATALGNYTLALACGELMWQVGRAMSWSAYGRVATAPLALAADLTARITRTVVAVEVVAAALAFIAGPATFTLVYGPAFSDAGPVLRLLVPGMALYAADSILSYFISVKIGRPDVILRVEGVMLVLCAVGSFATVGRFGMIGPAVATSFAYFVSFAIKSALFVRMTGISLRSLLLIEPSDFRRPRVTADHSGSAVA